MNLDVNLLKQVYGNDSDSSIIKTIIDTASPIIVIVLFIIERLLSRDTRKNDLQIAWYYRIMIEPNSQKIDKFFENIIVQYKNSASALVRTLPADLAHQKSIQYGIFSSVKRKLEIEVIQHFYMSYRHVAIKLTDLLNEVQDLFTQTLDSGVYTSDVEEKMSTSIYSIKARFYECLWEPIENTKLSKKTDKNP